MKTGRFYFWGKEIFLMREELLKGLSEEQKKKIAECKSAEEVLALAKAEGVELNDEQLEAVSGGCGGSEIKCPKCGSSNIKIVSQQDIKRGQFDAVETVTNYRCLDCNHKWYDK